MVVKYLRILKVFYAVVTLMCTAAIDIDNHLVSAQTDCFDRIALGAMLPFEKTFRTSDTNSLKVCQELCLREGEKCNTISFGIHVRGNGTCQLSSIKVDTTQKRPPGTIFDPDFDLYQRKTNCFTIPDDSNFPPPSILNEPPTSTTIIRPSPPPYGPVTPFDDMPTIITGRPQPPTTYANSPETPEDRYTPGTTNTFSAGGDPTIDTRFQSTGGNPYPSTGYEVTETESARPTDSRFPTSLPPASNIPTDSQVNNNQNTIYFSHDSDPLYKYPTLYEQNYPMPNSRPVVYAPNAPVIYTRYTPTYPTQATDKINETNRPYYGLGGYGNGYSYGTPVRYGNGYSYGTPVKNGGTSPATSYPTQTFDTRPATGYDRPSSPNYNTDSRPSTGYTNGNTRPLPSYTPSDTRPSNGYTPSNTRPPSAYPQSDTRPPPGYNTIDTRPPSGYPQSDTRPPSGYPQSDTRPPSGYPQSDTRPPSGYPQSDTRPPSGYPQPDTRPPSGYPQSDTRPPPGYNTIDTRPPSYSTTDTRLPPGYTSSDTRPPNGYTNGYTRPPYTDTRPPSSFADVRPTSGYGGGDARPEYLPNQQRPDNRPLYDNRPDQPYDPNQRPTTHQGPGYVIPLSPTSPTSPHSHSPSTSSGYSPTATTSGGKYDVTKEPIETYFNPDDYYDNYKWTTRPGIRYPHHHDYNFACFRRVLAGKRIAPHWVRRTLACERVEDCMQECGHEKRFTCEGFNYRLDPSGHGQGDCELIEVPLSEMGLYSSTQSRDSNLLRHPDYDYYERDRNAPTSCKPSPCVDCSVKPYVPPSYYRPEGPRPYDGDLPPSGPYATGPDHYRPKDTALDRYRPRPPIYDSRPSSYPPRPHPPPPHVYDTRPPPDYPFSSSGSGGYRPSYGVQVDRHDVARPDDTYRPGSWQLHVTPIHDAGYGVRDPRPPLKPTGHGTIFEIHDPLPPPGPESHKKPLDAPEYYTPPYRPDPHSYGPSGGGGGGGYYRPQHDYLDRDRPQKPPTRFVPYSIGADGWGTYGVRYGDRSSQGYGGIPTENRRKDPFDYFQLGDRHDYHGDNTIWSYPGSKYDDKFKGRPDYGSQWIRRPGDDECSVKSSEGFRLNKGVIRSTYTAPSVTECERMCTSENGFICHTYSYRYSQPGRENCQLCDRPYNNLDFYHDIEPDRDFDIYSMTDDRKTCLYPSGPPRSPHHGGGTDVGYPRHDNSAQCFFRAIDATRFTKPIVRDSLNVRSVGECEMECIKSAKFTCRAFSFRYGQRKPGGIIDNCQLSDWPVREMDKTRHLQADPSFDIFERASYGHGCEIQPIIDDKHKKLCYLGYGSPAKLLSSAIKKVISVPTELDCKHECIRYRENTPFKCYSFSFGSRASTFNCEMSDLDQSELKLNIHYAHTHDRDYWLFAWNPFDWTCRDKIITIGGNRINNDRRMDIFREPGGVTWRHYTVSGKPCRLGSGCDKNLVSGFYSCEIDTGEVGSWDYCCRADHPCGYSQGFEYPWCFVGDELDQWRKCSDRYYPGLTSDSQHIITITHLNNKTKPEFQKPPRPGGLQNIDDINIARLWPVTYIYTEGPPNATELSNFVDCNKENC